MEECESLDSEMRELQEFQSETSDTNSQDGEDEVEELHNSLREVVQDPSVKPKLQCLMVDPSFSMVTVQSEDSGIVWETASSRCSTPWASETSSISEGYSMEGSGSAGKITIVFDEEKIIRRRTRSGGRISRLGDRLSRPGSSRSASALGIERPEMAEVSLPNTKPEQSIKEPDLDEIKNKDQQLFSLISEGYEILNIRVPSKLPTVDEEENTELQDNLSYLNMTPKIKSRNHFDWPQQQAIVDREETHDHQEPPKQEEETEPAHTPTPKDSTGDIDYFEKFTLLDEVVPAEQPPEQHEEVDEPAEKPSEKEQNSAKETVTDIPSASEETFVFVTDVDIVEEHLDEVFYGEGPPTDVLHHHEVDNEARRRRQESQRSRVESGSVLFGGEETTLTPIYISPGPPKIIDPILLEEPTAMSFMYSDLYEDAMGERKESGREHSIAESQAPERLYKRRSSEEAPDGYLEKFTLKDETPIVDIQPDPAEDKRNGRMMWSQSKFEMTGCLMRVEKEDNNEKTEEPKTQEDSVGIKSEEVPSAVQEVKTEAMAETEKIILHIPAVVEEHTEREASQDKSEESQQTPEKIHDQQVNVEVKSDRNEFSEHSTEKPEVHEEELTMENRKEKEDLQEEAKAIKIPQTSTVTEKKAIKVSEEKEECKPTEEKLTMEVKTDQTELPQDNSEKPEVHQEECITEDRKEDRHKDKKQTVVETDKEVLQATEAVEEQDVREGLTKESKSKEKMEDQQVTAEVQTDQIKACESKTSEAREENREVEKRKDTVEHQEELEIICEERIPETKQNFSSEKEPQELIETPGHTTVNTEFPPVNTKSETQTTLTESVSTEEGSPDDKMVPDEEQRETETKGAPVEVKEPHSKQVEGLTSSDLPAEVEASPETSSICEGKKTVEIIPEDLAPVEVITDSDSAVHTIVEVTRKTMSEREIETQVQIELQDAMNTEEIDARKELPEREQVHISLPQETAAETTSKSENVMALQDLTVKVDTSNDVTKPQEKQQEKQQTRITENEPDQIILITDHQSKHTTDDPESFAQDIVNVGDDLIVFVPKGQAVEMDVEISQWSEMAAEDTPVEAKTRTELEVSTEESKAENQEEVEQDVSAMEDLSRPELEVETRPESEVETRSELEVATRPELEVKTRPELDLETRSELEVETRPEPEVETRPEPEAETRPELELETGPELEVETSPEPEVETRPEPEAEIRPELELETGPELEVETRPERELETRPELKVETRPELELESRAELEVETRPELELESRPELEVETRPELELESRPELEVETRPELEVETRSELELESRPELELESRPELEVETRPELEVETRPDRELETRPELKVETRSELELETRPEHELDTRSELEVETRPELKVDTRSELELEIRPELELENRPDLKVECRSELEVKTRPELKVSAEETKTENQEEEEREDSAMEVLALNTSDTVFQPHEPDEIIIDKQDLGLDEDTVIISPLRSFTPLEDLSELPTEDASSEDIKVDQKSDHHEEEPQTVNINKDVVPDITLHSDDIEDKTEEEGVIPEAPEILLEELEYEVITEQDAKDIQEAEAQRDIVAFGQDEEMDVQKEEVVEDLIEADYEIIDAEEENQARLAAELQGMDWFCATCGYLLSDEDYGSEEHHHHKVDTVDKAYEEIKETLSDWISELQGRSENIEDLVSELELAYNSVEDQCVESEAAMQAQNEEMMAQVMEQYNNMSISMEEEKKTKLEQLYDQIVTFQESIDSAKATLETTSREAETDARSPEDIEERLKAALDSTLSLELGPKGLLVFQDYAKANASSSSLTQRKGIPVPQRPTLQPQEPGSASSTSVTVYWNVNAGDIIDCFQVYCMEDPTGAISEEYRVTVKESYCVLEELDPDKLYKVWVMAVNYTGCSLPSDRLVFRTAPSVPVIDTERCTILWDSATLRWSSPRQIAGQSYTLEYCRQYELEGEGLRSVTGIKVCEQKVFLQPNENYLFYIKAVNEAGVSEQSEAALISTKGTRFHLLNASAHPYLELSADQTVVHYSQDAHKAAIASDKQCPSILGDLLPARGVYYWETTVSGCAAYRLGVSDSAVNRNSPLGTSSLTWCLQCIPSPSGCRYQLLHNDVQSTVFVTETPERVGVLLDYQLGRLSFYNSQCGQLLGSFTQNITQPCHPALGLELPGSLGVSMVLEVPEFARDS